MRARLLSTLLVFAAAAAGVQAAELSALLSDQGALNAVLDEMEAKVLVLAANVTASHAKRCTYDYQQCERKNYDNCVSLLPHATCPDQPSGPYCGSTCKTQKDYTVSNIHFAHEPAGVESSDYWNTANNPKDPYLIESVCYTRHLDEIFVRNNDEFKAKGTFAVLPNQYFGSANGTANGARIRDLLAHLAC